MKSSPSNNLKEIRELLIKYKVPHDMRGYLIHSVLLEQDIAALVANERKSVLSRVLDMEEMQPSPMPNNPDDLDKGRNFGQNESKAEIRAAIEGLKG